MLGGIIGDIVGSRFDSIIIATRILTRFGA